jgi:hypothetical protein
VSYKDPQARPDLARLTVKAGHGDKVLSQV